MIARRAMESMQAVKARMRGIKHTMTIVTMKAIKYMKKHIVKMRKFKKVPTLDVHGRGTQICFDGQVMFEAHTEGEKFKLRSLALELQNKRDVERWMQV